MRPDLGKLVFNCLAVISTFVLLFGVGEKRLNITSEGAIWLQAFAVIVALFVGLFVPIYQKARATERDRQKDDDHAAKIRALIAEELGSCAAAHIPLHRMLRRHMELPPVAGRRQIPLEDWPVRAMPLTAAMGPDLLTLEKPQVAIITQLLCNILLSQEKHRRLSSGNISLHDLAVFSAEIGRDIELLATAFEMLAPNRRLQFAGHEPELASELLRQEAQQPA
ncbi:MAG: hypothetical protein ABWY00_02700 [Dongiaceae bacterium]